MSIEQLLHPSGSDDDDGNNVRPTVLTDTGLQAENAQLKELVRSSKGAIERLQKEIQELSEPPQPLGIFERWTHYDNGHAFVIVRGERNKVIVVLPQEEKTTLQSGVQVLLNQSGNVVGIVGRETVGETAEFLSYLEGDRALVVTQSDNEMVVNLAAGLLEISKLREGDKLLINRARFAYERLPRTETENLLLERVPDISYEDVGGLKRQVGQIQDAVELPIVQADLFKVYGLEAPKGVLLYGPPGCGKTLIAKAVANSLAGQLGGHAFFINIKGPELLTKWVGETERKIREVFQQAREKAGEGHVVVVFFDEMESLFRQRGAGISSDTESTVVPQLLAEIDGVEDMHNVIVIGASNRPDLIDPAVLRPGRLDIKITVERPDEEGASDIFSIYLNDDVPIHPDEAGPATMIEEIVKKIYAESSENEFLEVTYEKGDKEKLYFKDFLSGAMIANLVRRAKRIAIKEELATGERGVRLDHLMVAVKEEFRENEDLPNTTNPDDWARISGRKGAKILGVRSIVQERNKPSTDTVAIGRQYL